MDTLCSDNAVNQRGSSAGDTENVLPKKMQQGPTEMEMIVEMDA